MNEGRAEGPPGTGSLDSEPALREAIRPAHRSEESLASYDLTRSVPTAAIRFLARFSFISLKGAETYDSPCDLRKVHPARSG